MKYEIIDKNQQTKIWFFEKTKRMDLSSDQQDKEQNERSHILPMNEKEIVATDSIGHKDQKRTIKEML